MKKILSVLALICAFAMPMHEAQASSPIPMIDASGVGLILTYLVANQVDPWTPLAQDLFGAHAQIAYEYPAHR